MGKNNQKERLFTIEQDKFEFQAKRGSGSGGQKKNKTSSAIQCYHPPSGARGEAEDTRSQLQNKKLAFKRCCETTEFQVWVKMKIDAANGLIEIHETDENGRTISRKLNHEELDSMRDGKF